MPVSADYPSGPYVISSQTLLLPVHFPVDVYFLPALETVFLSSTVNVALPPMLEQSLLILWTFREGMVTR